MELKLGYKQSEVGIIPDDWNVRSIKNISHDMLQGVNTAIDIPEYVEDGIPMLKANNIIDGEVNLKTADHISLTTYQHYSDRFKIKINDFLFSNIGARLGTGSLMKKEIACSFAWNVMRIIPNTEIVSPAYLNYIMNSPALFQEIKKNESGSGMGFIPKNVLRNISFPLPPTLQEQTAITQVLSDTDELISSLEKFISKKRNIKQGTMQQLLTGKKRLPGFAGAWETKKLGDCLLRKPDYGINAAAVDYSDNLPVYIRITDITEDGKFSPDKIVSVNKINSEKYILENDDLVFARTGASTGKTYLYNPLDGVLVFAGFLIRVKVDPQKLNPIYLKSYTSTASYWRWVSIMSMRSGQPGINGNEYSQLPIILPPTIQEQISIAQILSDMDSEIEALEKKRDKYKAIKQGMMQELLTGRIRLVLPMESP